MKMDKARESDNEIETRMKMSINEYLREIEGEKEKERERVCERERKILYGLMIGGAARGIWAEGPRFYDVERTRSVYDMLTVFLRVRNMGGRERKRGWKFQTWMLFFGLKSVIL